MRTRTVSGEAAQPVNRVLDPYGNTADSLSVARDLVILLIQLTECGRWQDRTGYSLWGPASQPNPFYLLELVFHINTHMYKVGKQQFAAWFRKMNKFQSFYIYLQHFRLDKTVFYKIYV